LVSQPSSPENSFLWFCSFLKDPAALVFLHSQCLQSTLRQITHVETFQAVGSLSGEDEETGNSFQNGKKTSKKYENTIVFLVEVIKDCAHD
jgi:hypothetical protein